MRTSLRRAFLAALAADGTTEQGPWGFRIRCLHCRHTLHFDPTGRPLDGGTLEHVVPRSWFPLRGARALTEGLCGPDDPRNLAVACGRCNAGKGCRHDGKGPGDARALEVVLALVARRRAREAEG